jgi:hypothetical protein
MERIIPMLEIPQSPEPYNSFIQSGSGPFDLFMAVREAQV